MRGNNTICMNKATICEALREYLAKRWTGQALAVTDFDAGTGENYGTWVVAVAESDSELPAARKKDHPHE